VGRRVLATIALPAAVIIALLIAAGSSAATRLPVVPVGGPNGQQLETRPGYIGYSLSRSLAGARQVHNAPGRLRWASWTSQQALGSGYDWIPKRCHPIPICPGLGFNLYAADVRLYRPRIEHDRLVFTRMRITYKHTPPPSSPRTWTLDVIYISGGFNWSLTF
jgi:hypothetical protein